MRVPLPAALERNPDLDTWISIDRGGTVTLFTGKAELGQGLRTAIARIGAEELDVSLERIRVMTADTARGPLEGITAGSTSIEQSGGAMRQAAAEARAFLLELAAGDLGVAPSDLSVDDGRVTSSLGGETDYWRLLGGKRFERAATGTPVPKPVGDHLVVGRRAPRIDLPGIVTGSTRFVQDLIGPGVLHGRVVRPPSPNARLVEVDERAAAELAGVVAVVRDGSFLGVVSEREEQADRAAAVLRAAIWEESNELPQQDTLCRWLQEQDARRFLVVDGTPVHVTPGAIEEPTDSVATIRAIYTKPYTMHGSIGPSAAAAEWSERSLHVWSATQSVEFLQGALAAAFELPAAAVRVSHVEGPGCYGHNGADDAALDAALLARAANGRRVLLRWAREDEHAWEPYGPASVVELQGSLNADGAVIDWNHETWSNTHLSRPLPGTGATNLLATAYREGGRRPDPPEPRLQYHVGIHRNADPLYRFPRKRIVKSFVPLTPIRVSSLRSLGAYANIFAIESFMDELAEVARMDALEFRLRHLEDERARAVLVAAAESAGWGDQLEEGWGCGLAFARYKNIATYAAVAMVVRVDDETAAIRLERAVIAADAGELVDPDGLANQLEGGLVQSASWTLKEEVTFDERRITSLDWETYPILTFEEVPEIETVLLDRPGSPSLGAGEATQGPTAAAIANAVYDAVGIRARDIPLTPERLRVAAASR